MRLVLDILRFGYVPYLIFFSGSYLTVQNTLVNGNDCRRDYVPIRLFRRAQGEKLRFFGEILALLETPLLYF